MSRQYQDSNYNYPSYPNSSQQSQSGQYAAQPSANTYNDRQGQAYPSYPEDSLHPQSSGQRQGSHSPYAGHMQFPEPEHGHSRGSAGYPQNYVPPPQNTANLTVGTRQHERRGSHGGYAESPGSFSDGQPSYSTGTGSDTTGGGSIYSSQSHGGVYPTVSAQPLSANATGYDEGHESRRAKAPPSRPADIRNRTCRYPDCSYQVLFDSRVNEYREWCSEHHMLAALRDRVEKPCIICQVWARRNGSRFCSNACRSHSQNRR